MFWHNFRYQLKILLRDHALVFWTLAFPLIMATFFQLAFSNIESSEKLDLIKIAAVVQSGSTVDSATENVTANSMDSGTIILESLQSLSDPSSEMQLFDTSFTTQEEAERMLAAGEISAVVQLNSADQNSEVKILAHTSGVDVTILKVTLESILDQARIVEYISQHAPKELAGLIKAQIVHLHDSSPAHLSYTMIEFYTLIAMTCLYGGIIGMAAVNHLLANMSASGKRIAVSPTPKLRLLASSLLASYLVQLAGLVLLFAYTVGVLGINYGDDLPLIILLALVGSCCGLALGAMVASVFRVSENAKTGLIIAISMFGCFLAGMMGITMKYIVDQNAGWLNQINPANLITDGFYALYYYGAGQRFWSDVTILLIITLVIIGISSWALRKEQYDNL